MFTLLLVGQVVVVNKLSLNGMAIFLVYWRDDTGIENVVLV